MINEKLSKAFELYENELDIINTITSDSYISVTEVSKLLNTILDVKHLVEPKHINHILLDYEVIIKSNNKLNLKTNKFIANTLVKNYYKEIASPQYKFYIWDARLIFCLLKLDFRKNINKNTVMNFCNFMSKYIHNKKFNINIIHNNLKELQLIFNEYPFCNIFL